ncbi:probable 39S ribosomal protein L45, mitochondrial [Chelonus insularis]|uniref:probable 39S ribosomal protein L45, mitochondrial n=1 Tax=Chelonus insularis TaxID=460826 RepID=UPI00158A14F8|nr:probable 39S ribosomal protein L45, mitochondrial [Chelonus insularis]
MSNLIINSLNSLSRIVQSKSSILLSTAEKSIIVSQTRGTKHWNPKWKKWRAAKVIKIKLPDYQKNDETDETVLQEKMRTKLKEMGLQPNMPWIEKQTYISCTGGIFEAYVPPEGDGKFSIVSATGAKQRASFMRKKGTSYMAVRKIRSFDDDFTLEEFETEAEEIYIKAHKAIAKKDEDELRLNLTEKALVEAQHNTLDKTIRWRYIETLEPPRVVHARNTSVITKENIYAQLTVRFHSTQTLAIYDRFGRLMHGSEIVKKDVLEYVVFEKHLSNKYGLWRIHGKIIPSWMPEREYAERTFLKPEEKHTIETTPPPSQDSQQPITA